jgi:hypothetical protein
VPAPCTRDRGCVDTEGGAPKVTLVTTFAEWFYDALNSVYGFIAWLITTVCKFFIGTVLGYTRESLGTAKYQAPHKRTVLYGVTRAMYKVMLIVALFGTARSEHVAIMSPLQAFNTQLLARGVELEYDATTIVQAQEQCSTFDTVLKQHTLLHTGNGVICVAHFVALAPGETVQQKVTSLYQHFDDLVQHNRIAVEQKVDEIHAVVTRVYDTVVGSVKSALDTCLIYVTVSCIVVHKYFTLTNILLAMIFTFVVFPLLYFIMWIFVRTIAKLCPPVCVTAFNLSKFMVSVVTGALLVNWCKYKIFTKWALSAKVAEKVVPDTVDEKSKVIPLIFLNTVNGVRQYRTNEHGSLRFTLTEPSIVADERAILSSPIVVSSTVKSHDYVYRIIDKNRNLVVNASILQVDATKEYYLVTAAHGFTDASPEDRWICIRGVEEVKYKIQLKSQERKSDFIQGSAEIGGFPTRYYKHDADVLIFHLPAELLNVIQLKRSDCYRLNANSASYQNMSVAINYWDVNCDPNTSRGNLGGSASDDTKKKWSVTHTCSTTNGACGAILFETGTKTAMLMHTTGYMFKPQNAGAELLLVFMQCGLVPPPIADGDLFDDHDDGCKNESNRTRGIRNFSDDYDGYHTAKRSRGTVRGDRYVHDESVSSIDVVLVQAVVDAVLAKLGSNASVGNTAERVATTAPEMQSRGLTECSPQCPLIGTDSIKSSEQNFVTVTSKKARKRDKTAQVSFASGGSTESIDSSAPPTHTTI